MRDATGTEYKVSAPKTRLRSSPAWSSGSHLEFLEDPLSCESSLLRETLDRRCNKADDEDNGWGTRTITPTTLVASRNRFTILAAA
mmetsp:Transcript_9342/g.10510  ORF Transcript_9342/g.10510 Transcript_9342/m.10510 type:complete len:86 (+) Transcript_9342:186-443(+)